MTITDDMIARACVALYRETSGDFEPTNDEMREMLTALAPLFAESLAAAPAEPVAWRPAWVVPSPTWNDGPPRQQDIDYYTREGIGIEYAYAAPQPAGEVTVTRREDGSIAAVTRTDDDGRVLSVIAECQRKPARPVALPALPRRWTWTETSPARELFTADQMRDYARACAAAWGVTLDDTDTEE